MVDVRNFHGIHLQVSIIYFVSYLRINSLPNKKMCCLCGTFSFVDNTAWVCIYVYSFLIKHISAYLIFYSTILPFAHVFSSFHPSSESLAHRTLTMESLYWVISKCFNAHFFFLSLLVIGYCLLNKIFCCKMHT